MGKEAGKWVRRQFPRLQDRGTDGAHDLHASAGAAQASCSVWNTPDSELGTEAPAVEPAGPEAPAERPG